MMVRALLNEKLILPVEMKTGVYSVILGSFVVGHLVGSSDQLAPLSVRTCYGFSQLEGWRWL